MTRRCSLGVALVVLFAVAPLAAAAQDFRGRINGTVADQSGAVLPGVTVVATSPALIQPQTTTTGADGVYRMIALPPGLYELTFELAGFQSAKRTDIRVVINTTLSVDASMTVAALEETVTVTSASPVVDTSTTGVGTNFTKELLTEIPNARDVWAAMAQAPGLQMTGYDVGGSHTGTQTGYLTYGMSDQNSTRLEGINTTEATDSNAGYFDFGSFEEFQIGGAGNMAEMDVPGASLNITVKSGGDRFHGTWYSDYEGKNLVSNNVPDEFRVAGGTIDGGYNVAAPLDRGNPIDRQYDINGSLGGPVKPGKAWFFASYRLNDQYRYVIGFDELARSKLTNPWTLKGTYQLSRANQIIGYTNKREKLQAYRDIGPTTPLSASRYQSSRNYPWKVEWTSVLSPRMFLDVLVGRWTNYFPLRPQSEVGNFPADQFVPGRRDEVTLQRFDGGAHDSYQDQKRYKPQFTASLAWVKDRWAGSHDFKFGTEIRRDRRIFIQDQPFNIFYRDRSGAVSEVDVYNTPVEPTNDVNYRAGYVNDTWKLRGKLTLNLGLRVEHYTDGWPEQDVAPEGVPALAGDPRFASLFQAKTVEGRTVARTTTAAPRAGFAYDLTGRGKSVVKAFYGRFYFNSADTVADVENPVGRLRARYRFNDLNGNRIVDGPQEIGAFVRTLDSAAGAVTVDPNLERPYGEEASTHLEQEIAAGLSGRVSYVYKNIRNEWDDIDANRVGRFTTPITLTDPGPDGRTGTSDDRPIQAMDLQPGTTERRMFTNVPDFNSDFHTVEFAVNRRFNGRWMALTSFEYTWRKAFFDVAQQSTSTLGVAGVSKVVTNETNFQWDNPNQRPFGRETQRLWNYKAVGRYTLPYAIGISGSYKLQSGRQWGRIWSAPFPVAGATGLRVEPADERRAPNVGIFDIRLDKSVQLPGRGGRLTGVFDVFNLTNSDVVTNFNHSTGSSFLRVISLLDPRIVRLGVRWEF
jgi:Carboxypeptidase regulatory-like domain